MLCYIFTLSQKQKTNKQRLQWETTAQLYPGRDTFEFDQGHVTNNQPITVLALLSKSLVTEYRPYAKMADILIFFCLHSN